MKSIALLVALAGVATTTSPAVAETNESKPNRNLDDFEYSSESYGAIVQQSQGTESDNDEEKDEDERTDGFYFPLSIGGQQLNGVDAQTTINDNKYRGSLNNKLGFTGETGIGYKTGDFRFDMLYGYNDLNRDNYSLSGSPSVSNQTTGSANLQTLQFGVSYDINNNSRWTPYIGGTIGAGWISVGNSSFEVDGVKYKVKGDTASALVYGGKVGLSYKVSRRWDIFAEGAYLRTNSFDLNLEAEGENTSTENITSTTPGTTTPGTRTYNKDNEQVAGGGVTCEVTFGVNGAPWGGLNPPETCFDTTAAVTTAPVTTTTSRTVSTKPVFKNMDFGPGNGWSAKIGFRWFFNQHDPAPIEIAEEIPVEQPAPEPVYEEPAYQAPPQGTPVRALW